MHLNLSGNQLDQALSNNEQPSSSNKPINVSSTTKITDEDQPVLSTIPNTKAETVPHPSSNNMPSFKNSTNGNRAFFAQQQPKRENKTPKSHKGGNKTKTQSNRLGIVPRERHN